MFKVKKRFNTGSTQVQLRSSSGSAQVQLRFNSGSTQVQVRDHFRFNSGSTEFHFGFNLGPTQLLFMNGLRFNFKFNQGPLKKFPMFIPPLKINSLQFEHKSQIDLFTSRLLKDQLRLKANISIPTHKNELEPNVFGLFLVLSSSSN